MFCTVSRDVQQAIDRYEKWTGLPRMNGRKPERDSARLMRVAFFQRLKSRLSAELESYPDVSKDAAAAVAEMRTENRAEKWINQYGPHAYEAEKLVVLASFLGRVDAKARARGPERLA